MPTVSTLPTIPQRVANGVDWLDATVPGWPSQVRIEDFDIQSPCMCVLGQVFRDADGYTGGLCVAGFDVEDLDDANWWAIEHGFDSSISSLHEWEQLQREWERAITAGREARVLALV